MSFSLSALPRYTLAGFNGPLRDMTGMEGRGEKE